LIYPVEEKPVILSKHVPLATTQFVPPPAIPSAANVIGDAPPPALRRGRPDVPALDGRLKKYADVAALFLMVTDAPRAPPLAKTTAPVSVAFCPIVSVGLTHVRDGLPASVEKLLNWTCVFDPPAEPAPAAHDWKEGGVPAPLLKRQRPTLAVVAN